MTAKEIRQAFLDFFAAKGHTIVPSAPIVVKNDPTLMFTNAGMNQFKDIFLGEAPAKSPRVADTQRCLRVSGKHNDLEEVGIDTYHHTMFEMLGNWSFGDYFKKEAIAWSWELLTEVYKLDKDRLYVTYFEGDEKEGLAKDTETYDLWKAYVAEDHILPGNKKDNFWEMGENGPCGPCSEIHFDSRPDNERAEVSGAVLVNADHDQVIEIWNNVFMQFNRTWGGEGGGQKEFGGDAKLSGVDEKKWKGEHLYHYTSLVSLPAQHVDTGMGFERLVRIIQGKTSNYDTDVFEDLIILIAKRCKGRYTSSNGKTDVAMRVIADHIRAVSFAIADGQLPSNKEAGYVIRRILRRAIRYAYHYLRIQTPFINELVPELAMQFENVFPELISQKDFVQRVVLEEEISFLRTLGVGLAEFESFIKTGEDVISKGLIPYVEIGDSKFTSGKSERIIPGDFAFFLSDSRGFPVDLTELIARENGWTVDMEAFEKELQAQKSRSRAATAIDTGDWIILKDDESVKFTGYTETETIAHIVKYRKVKAKGVEQFQIVLDKTPFYAESGGQVGDTGELIFPDGEIINVTDTKKENGLIVHFVDKLPGSEAIEDALTAMVDVAKRTSTNSNHSATHLLHAALKQVLGSHVNQKGSLVNNEYLRFDFSHFSKVTDEEIAKIEAIVNEKIRANIGVDIQELPKEQAIAMGANALFGEKYGDTVRVVTMDMAFSIELCGGTHVVSTGQIGYFKIVAESAVAAGVRRIEAITGEAVEKFINAQTGVIHQLKELLKNPKDIAKSVESLLEENTRLKKEIEKSVLEKSAGLKNELAQKAEEINGINFIAQKVELPNADAVKNLAYHLKDLVPNLFLVLAAEIDGKPNLSVMIADNLVKEKGLNAGTIVRELAKEIQGGGGGQPFFATAGGKDLSGLERALEKAKTLI